MRATVTSLVALALVATTVAPVFAQQPDPAPERQHLAQAAGGTPPRPAEPPPGGAPGQGGMMGGMPGGHGMGGGMPMMMCPMMHGSGMSGAGMMSMMGGMMDAYLDPTTRARMLQMRGEMLKSLGEVMMKYGKAMESAP